MDGQGVSLLSVAVLREFGFLYGRPRGYPSFRSGLASWITVAQLGRGAVLFCRKSWSVLGVRLACE